MCESICTEEWYFHANPLKLVRGYHFWWGTDVFITVAEEATES